MRISCLVVAGAKHEHIEHQVDLLGNEIYKIRVMAPPKEGKANKAIIGLLSDYFSVPRSRIHIAHGQTGRQKIIDVDGI